MKKLILGMNPWVLFLMIVVLGITVLGYLDLKKDMTELRQNTLPQLEDNVIRKVFE